MPDSASLAVALRLTVEAAAGRKKHVALALAWYTALTTVAQLTWGGFGLASVASQMIVSEAGVAMTFPAASRYWTRTVLVPTQVASVQALGVAYASHGSVSNVPSSLIFIWLRPEPPVSLADRVRLTAVS